LREPERSASAGCAWAAIQAGCYAEQDAGEERKGKSKADHQG